MSFEYAGQKILIIGGAGYIGSHVCKMIADQGGLPITIDNLSSGHKKVVKYGPLVQADLRNRHEVQSALSAHNDAFAVVHLASSIEVGLGEKDPSDFYENNVIGAFNLLEEMRENNLNRIIFSSTCATYGESETLPLTEKEAQTPFSVYGKTKLAIEHMIQSYHTAYGLNFVTLRYFNAAGADPSGEIGEEHDPETHLIPIALAAAAGLRPQLKIFGLDYDTPDGTCVRDYIHVNDIARAHLVSLAKLTSENVGLQVNIGTGRGYSNLEIIKTIEAVTGLNLPFDPAPRRPGDVAQLFADTTMAKTELGFEPVYSKLTTIIETAWNFHRKNWNI